MIEFCKFFSYVMVTRPNKAIRNDEIYGGYGIISWLLMQ